MGTAAERLKIGKSTLIKDQEASYLQRRKFLHELRSLVLQSDTELQKKIRWIHENEDTSRMQHVELEKEVAQLNNNASKCNHQAAKARAILKDTGDVQHWAEKVDQSIRILEFTIGSL